MKVPDILARTGLGQPKPQFHAATAAAHTVLPQTIALVPVASSKRIMGFVYRYWVGVFALLFLVIGVAGISLGNSYWTTYKIPPIVSSSAAHKRTVPLHGPNIAVPSAQLPATLQQIDAQPLALAIGGKSVPVPADTIKSWLHIVNDQKTKTAYIHLDDKAIGPSLNQLTSKFAQAPINQVTVTHPDGTQLIVVGGRNGVNVPDSDALAKQLAPNILSGKGAQLSVPLTPVAFQSVTAASFDKLIEVNVNTKQMYLYDKGNFTRQYAISAGAPATPTPIGQFKIYAKYSSQDMKGLNPDGTPYFQPKVPWINYFLPGGYAVHGNYWRPASVFGAVNTSHGCVSLPVDQAAWVYNWAPIGTTVITHA